VTTIALVIYAAGLPLLWYHKYCTVLDVFDQPKLYNSSPLYVALSAMRLVLAWRSIAAIWSLIGRSVHLLSRGECEATEQGRARHADFVGEAQTFANRVHRLPPRRLDQPSAAHCY
jgi:hypothetical protein